MKKVLFVLTVITALSVVSASAQGNRSGKPVPTPTPVLNVTFGYCTPGDLDCESLNRLRNDVNRPYVNGSEGMAIQFFVGGSNDLTVNFSGASRTATYDLTYMAAAGNPTPTWVSQPQALKPAINVLGAYNAKLQCGGAATCDINYVTGMNGGGFAINRINYRLQWHPASVQPYINTPETTSAVNVHYIKDLSGEVFIITPLPNPETSRIIAGLQGETGRSVTAGGQYVMPFTMTVRLQ